MRQRMELELAERTLGRLELNPEWTEAEAKESEGFIDVGLSESSNKEVLFNKVQEKLSIIYSEGRSLEADIVKAYLKYADDEKFGELYEKYSELFKKHVSLGKMEGDDPGSDDDNDGGSDDENDNGGSDNDGSGNDRDFSKVSLDDFEKDPSRGKKEAGVQNEVGEKEADIVEPAENVTGVEDYEFEINNTPKTNNVDFVNEVIDSLDEETRQGLVVTNASPATPERVATRASKGSPEIILAKNVKWSPFLYLPYMNKKTKVVPRITKLEFMVGNSLFSMRGDKIETFFETHSGIKVSSHLDANVIDCWGAIVNHEESFKDVGSLSRHFFPIGCITKQMIDGSLDSEDQWNSFEAQVSAHFKDVAGISLKDVDLVFFPICNGGHFYVVVFSLFKTMTMTILDNIDSGATYDSKYKVACDGLKDMFARHLKLYRHKRHASIKKLNAKIQKLKWSTSSNFRDCGVFPCCTWKAIWVKLLQNGTVGLWLSRICSLTC